MSAARVGRTRQAKARKAAYYAMEVLYDLTWNLTHHEITAGGELFSDSRERFSTLMAWTSEFQRLHAHTDWEQNNYLLTIDAYFNQRIREF